MRSLTADNKDLETAPQPDRPKNALSQLHRDTQALRDGRLDDRDSGGGVSSLDERLEWGGVWGVHQSYGWRGG